MNKSDFVDGMLLGAAIGMLLVVVLVATLDENPAKIDACEASLPRDQECVLIAVPQSEA